MRPILDGDMILTDFFSFIFNFRMATSLNQSKVIPQRARVPIPNAAGYMVRPSSNVSGEGTLRKARRSGADARPIDRTLAKLRGPTRRA
jgi:hypothetical protein